MYIRKNGIAPNGPSTKRDVIDPATGERFPPKAVLRVAKELAGDDSRLHGGGWPTNDPLSELGFDIALKPHLESTDVGTDVENILRSDEDPTTKDRLVNARLGQGGFREALLEIWEGKCALTGCDIQAALRASHIKAWRISSNLERLDPSNGILLAASIDALFDRFLITFTPAGNVRASAELTIAQLAKLGVHPGARIASRQLNAAHMDWHRKEFERVSENNSFEL